MHRTSATRRAHCWRGKLRHLAVGLACAALLPPVGHAAQATFAWDSAGSAVAGFMLYCGVVKGGQTTIAYNIVIDAGMTTKYTVKGLAPGQVLQCAVTAYDAAGKQSGYSNAVRIYAGPAGRCVSACSGDLNGDGLVNTLDLGVIKRYWGTGNSTADLDGDGIVNALDLSLFRILFH
jgi:hypothetical protein